MKRIVIILTILTLLILSGLAIWQYWPSEKEPEIHLRSAEFSELPGWKTSKFKSAFETFKVSCRAFLKQDPEKSIGSPYLPMQVKDWHPLCKEAVSKEKLTSIQAQEFFEKWFSPFQFHNNKPVEGLFTGYYSPLLRGSLVKTKEFSVPIYGIPDDLITLDLGAFYPDMQYKQLVGRIQGKRVVPYHTRAEINQGALKKKAKVLVWVDNRIDRIFLEIQGSGAVELRDGRIMYIGYEGKNGAPYTSIAQVLIDKGVMTKHSASMQAIRRYLDAHPDQMDDVLHKNKSFVFFRKLNKNAAYGAQGVALVPGYSLAVDRKWIPLGSPLWLNTTRPTKTSDNKRSFQRLMIAQDTGGAIRGPVRGDVYWGAGEEATYVAGHMKNKGVYWLLLPKTYSLPG